jgi:hypothetical protein
LQHQSNQLTQALDVEVGKITKMSFLVQQDQGYLDLKAPPKGEKSQKVI